MNIIQQFIKAEEISKKVQAKCKHHHIGRAKYTTEYPAGKIYCKDCRKVLKLFSTWKEFDNYKFKKSI